VVSTERGDSAYLLRADLLLVERAVGMEPSKEPSGQRPWPEREPP
jgi:hypothetical protein